MAEQGEVCTSVNANGGIVKSASRTDSGRALDRFPSR